MVPNVVRKYDDGCSNWYKLLVVKLILFVKTSSFMLFKTSNPDPKIPVTSLLTHFREVAVHACNHDSHPVYDVSRNGEQVGLTADITCIVSSTHLRNHEGLNRT